MEKQTTEIAKKPNGKINFVEFLENIKPEMAKVLPSHLTPERVMKVYLTEIRKNPALKACSPESLASALMQSAQDGLEFGTNRCYLIPYGKEATYMRSYLGIVDLARRSGCLKKIGAGVVYENDHFDIKRGFDEILVHVPCFTSDERGELLGVYCYAELADGQRVSEYMTITEIESVRKRSKMANGGAWKSDYTEMAKKVVVKRMLKLLPLSAEFFKSMQQEDELEFLPPKPAKVTSDLNKMIGTEATQDEPPTDSYESENIEAEEIE